MRWLYNDCHTAIEGPVISKLVTIQQQNMWKECGCVWIFTFLVQETGNILSRNDSEKLL